MRRRRPGFAYCKNIRALHTSWAPRKRNKFSFSAGVLLMKFKQVVIKMSPPTRIAGAVGFGRLEVCAVGGVNPQCKVAQIRIQIHTVVAGNFCSFRLVAKAWRGVAATAAAAAVLRVKLLLLQLTGVVSHNFPDLHD